MMVILLKLVLCPFSALHLKRRVGYAYRFRVEEGSLPPRWRQNLLSGVCPRLKKGFVEAHITPKGKVISQGKGANYRYNKRLQTRRARARTCI